MFFYFLINFVIVVAILVCGKRTSKIIFKKMKSRTDSELNTLVDYLIIKMTVSAISSEPSFINDNNTL